MRCSEPIIFSVRVGSLVAIYSSVEDARTRLLSQGFGSPNLSIVGLFDIIGT